MHNFSLKKLCLGKGENLFVLCDLMLRILGTNLQNAQLDLAPGISQMETVMYFV